MDKITQLSRPPDLYENLRNLENSLVEKPSFDGRTNSTIVPVVTKTGTKNDI